MFSSGAPGYYRDSPPNPMIYQTPSAYAALQGAPMPGMPMMPPTMPMPSAIPSMAPPMHPPMISMPMHSTLVQACSQDFSAGFNTVSNDTSSQAPEDIKRRIFIGKLNTNQCSRQEVVELCRPYGTLTALAMLKGFAFVQYENPQESELAIQVLNGYNFYGQKLEVRPVVAAKQMEREREQLDDNADPNVGPFKHSGPIRRPRFDFLFGGQRIRVETANIRNRSFSQEAFCAVKHLTFHDHGKDDTIICGSCRSIFASMKYYIEHRRQKRCTFFEKELQPSRVSCFTCKEKFSESWEFVQHLIHRHSINLYKGQPPSDPVAYAAALKPKVEEQLLEKPAAENGGSQPPPANGEASSNAQAEQSSSTASGVPPPIPSFSVPQPIPSFSVPPPLSAPFAPPTGPPTGPPNFNTPSFDPPAEPKVGALSEEEQLRMLAEFDSSEMDS